MAGENGWVFYSRGLLTNLTNPKAAVFFGTILAPVLDQAGADWVVAAAIVVIVVNALWWHCLLAVLFGRPPVRRWYGRAKHVIDRVVGGAPGVAGPAAGRRPALRPAQAFAGSALRSPRPAALRAGSSALSVFSQVKSWSSRPKWP